MKNKAFQDLIPHNNCYGCGPENEKGLRIKSYWFDEKKSICEFTPSSHHCAGPKKYLNGGVIATLMDCHSVGTAIANAYLAEGREVGEGDHIRFVTGSISVSYKNPVPVHEKVILKAEIKEEKGKKTVVSCSLYSDEKICAVSELVAIRVPSDW